MEGRNIAILSENINTSGFNSAPLEWDLKDNSGRLLPQGIYPYRIRITDSSGSYAESYQKLVVIRQ
jgi:hypothetical protein